MSKNMCHTAIGRARDGTLSIFVCSECEHAMSLIFQVWIFSALVSALPFVGKMNKINGENECFINDSTWWG